jgi:hypothetical protein
VAAGLVAGVANARALRRTAVPAARAAPFFKKARRFGLDMMKSFEAWFSTATLAWNCLMREHTYGLGHYMVNLLLHLEQLEGRCGTFRLDIIEHKNFYKDHFHE